MSRPIAAADAALCALCCEFHTITDLVAQADAGEIDVDDEALGDAMKVLSRFAERSRTSMRAPKKADERKCASRFWQCASWTRQRLLDARLSSGRR